MWDLQAAARPDAPAPKDYIDVEYTRAPGLAARSATEGALYAFGCLQQLFRFVPSFNQYAAIAEPSVRWADRKAFDNWRYKKLSYAFVFKGLYCGRDHIAWLANSWVPLIRPQGNQVSVLLCTRHGNQISSQSRP